MVLYDVQKTTGSDRTVNGVKVFLRYVDDIIRTVKGDPGVVLEAANKLHPNLQFIIEELDSNGNLAFLDLNVNVHSAKKVTCGWYKKLTDTGTILNFRGCAPLQYKRNIIEGTVHRVFRSTSTWEYFDQALEKNRKLWIENQYPKNWSDRVVFETLNKIIKGKKNLEVKASEPRNVKWLKNSPPLLTMQYRGNPSQLLAAMVRQISGAQIIFTTRKLKTCLPSLKNSFARELRSKVVYKLTCSGCNSTYVGQTVRHLATRVDEHRKEDSPVGQHLLECNKEVGGTAELKSEIIDQTANTHKLLTLEALHIWRERPKINTRDEFRSRELTLKL